MQESLKFIMFSGKGGVGKTTSAAATAVHFAGLGKKTLLFSTDPAHSLCDSLEQQIGDGVTSVKGIENLFAMEINPDKMLWEVKEEFRGEIVKMLVTTTYLDEEDVSDVLSLTLPGLDEIMGIKRIMDFMEDNQFDIYIWDTAPTGHTLRLLSLPEALNDWVRVLARMQWKYKQMLLMLMKNSPTGFSEDDLLLTLKKTVTKVQRLLKEPGKNRFVAVTIPEAMSVNETKRMYKNLRLNGIPMKHVIINNVIPENSHCDFCSSRRKVQQQYLEDIRREFGWCNIVEIPQRAGEVKGFDGLKQFARKCAALFNDDRNLG